MDIKASPAGIIYQNLKKEFEKGIEEARCIAQDLYQVVPSTSDSNVYGWLGHIPGFREWNKNEPRVLRNVESFDFTVANRKFEETIQISIDTVEDNQLGSYAGIARQIGAQGKQVWDEIVFDLFNKAFTTTLAYDGLSWCNDAHKAGLSTVDNNLGALALSDTNFEAAVTRLRSFTIKPDKLSAARPLNPVADKLILLVPPALEVTAKKIVAVERIASGADNINYKTAEVMATSWITGTKWFVINAGSPLKPVFLQNRKPLEFRQLTPKDSDDAFMRDVYLYGAKMRCAALPTYSHLVIGSSGA